MKQFLEATFWIICLVMVVGIVFVEDEIAWIMFMGCVAAVWFAVAFYEVWWNTISRDDEDSDEEEMFL